MMAHQEGLLQPFRLDFDCCFSWRGCDSQEEGDVHKSHLLMSCT